jgi:hypothetical protein
MCHWPSCCWCIWSDCHIQCRHQGRSPFPTCSMSVITHCHIRQNTNTHAPASAKCGRTLVGAGGGHNLGGLVGGAIWAWGQTRPSSEPTSCKKHFHLAHGSRMVPRRCGWWPQPPRAGERCCLGLGTDSTNLLREFDWALSHPPKYKCQSPICSRRLLHRQG